MNIFRFIFDQKLTNYGDHSVTVKASLKIERFNEYYDMMDKIFKAITKRDEDLILVCKKLKGKSIKYDKEFIEDLSFEMNSKLEDVKHLASKVGLIDKKVMKKIDVILKTSLLSEEGKIIFGNLYDHIDDIISDVEIAIGKTKEMFVKLKAMEGRPLKVLIKFNEDDFETQFTKYHINMEHFGDRLNNILRNDFKSSLYDDLKKMENTFKDIVSSLIIDNVNVHDFLKSVNILSKVLEKMENDFDPLLLKSQPYYNEMMERYQCYIEKVSQIYKKNNQLYEFILEKYGQQEKVSHIKVAYLRIIYLSFQKDVETFLNITKEDYKKMIPQINDLKNDYIMSEYSVLMLDYIDPELSGIIRNNIIKEIQSKYNFSNILMNKGYMWKRAERGLFDNRQFYSHKVCLFKFLEESEFLENKYKRSGGIDAVEDLEQIVQRRGEVYSKVLKRKITYNAFVNLKTYYTNLNSNFTEVSLKEAQEQMRKRFSDVS